MLKKIIVVKYKFKLVCLLKIMKISFVYKYALSENQIHSTSFLTIQHINTPQQAQNKVLWKNKTKFDGSTGHGDFALSKETSSSVDSFASTKPK